MTTSVEDYNSMTKIYIGILMCFTVLDHVLIHIIGKYRLQVKNKYYKLHERYGLRKLSIIKIMIVIYIIVEFTLLNGPYGLKAGFIFGYSVVVFILLVDILRTKRV